MEGIKLQTPASPETGDAGARY